jgi:UDP-glucuronate 4-epimerase
MTRVLITGGAGFIGSNLTRHLLSQDTCEVICIDNFDPNYSIRQKQINVRPFIGNKNYTLIEGDIRRMEDIRKSGVVDTIIHLAAKAGVRPSIDEPILYHEVNVGGTQNLLEFAKFQDVRQFVFASSSSVYGINKNVPWREDDGLLPISPYAATKLSNEMLGHVYSHLYGIRFLALRFFTVYGPAQRPDLVIHKFFEMILAGMAIPVYGDGSTSRDYTFVDDICFGIIKAMGYTGSGFEIINLGNNYLVKLKDLIDLIERICCKKAIIEWRPQQPGDVPITYANIDKARHLLGYSPSTELITGLCSFYDWYLRNEPWLTTTKEKILSPDH